MIVEEERVGELRQAHVDIGQVITERTQGYENDARQGRRRCEAAAAHDLPLDLPEAEVTGGANELGNVLLHVVSQAKKSVFPGPFHLILGGLWSDVWFTFVSCGLFIPNTFSSHLSLHLMLSFHLKCDVFI